MTDQCDHCHGPLVTVHLHTADNTKIPATRCIRCARIELIKEPPEAIRPPGVGEEERMEDRSGDQSSTE